MLPEFNSQKASGLPGAKTALLMLIGSLILSVISMFVSLQAAKRIHPPQPISLECDPDMLLRAEEVRKAIESIAKKGSSAKSER